MPSVRHGADHLSSADSSRDRLWSMLGGAPTRRQPVVLASQPLTTQWPDMVGEKLLLDLNGDEPVPAYFLRPSGSGPFPLILYGHAHGFDYDLGKDEILRGRPELLRPYGSELVGRGYAVLTIDNWLFGERPRHGGESAFVKKTLLQGQIPWGMMLRDNAAALDFACAHRDIDPTRIAAMGLSMGSSLSWWLAALDERIRVCVDLCCLTDFSAAISTGGIDGHGFYYIVPGLLRSFDTPDINALIAPRPHLSLAGRDDPLTPAAGLDRIDEHLRAHYAKLGHAQAWQLQRFDCGHEEVSAMREAAIRFLDRWL